MREGAYRFEFYCIFINKFFWKCLWKGFIQYPWSTVEITKIVKLLWKSFGPKYKAYLEGRGIFQKLCLALEHLGQVERTLESNETTCRVIVCRLLQIKKNRFSKNRKLNNKMFLFHQLVVTFDLYLKLWFTKYIKNEKLFS